MRSSRRFCRRPADSWGETHKRLKRGETHTRHIRDTYETHTRHIRDETHTGKQSNTLSTTHYPPHRRRRSQSTHPPTHPCTHPPPHAHHTGTQDTAVWLETDGKAFWLSLMPLSSQDKNGSLIPRQECLSHPKTECLSHPKTACLSHPKTECLSPSTPSFPTCLKRYGVVPNQLSVCLYLSFSISLWSSLPRLLGDTRTLRRSLTKVISLR